MATIAGLTHVPNVYVYASAALKNLGSDVEEAARIAGASPLRVATTVSLPLIMPSLLFAAVLVFFLGFELFALPLVLLQRRLLQNARRYATIKGKAGRMRELPLGKWKWAAAGLLYVFLFL